MLAGAGHWARPPQLWPGRLQHEATVARPSQQWWHYRQCAEDRAGGHTTSPHLTSPVSCSDPSEAAASEVCCAVTVSQQWFRTNISSSRPQSNFPIFQELQNLSTFWSRHSSFCKSGAEPISQIVCIESIYIESESSFEPGVSPGQSHAADMEARSNDVISSQRFCRLTCLIACW